MRAPPPATSSGKESTEPRCRAICQIGALGSCQATVLTQNNFEHPLHARSQEAAASAHSLGTEL